MNCRRRVGEDTGFVVFDVVPPSPGVSNLIRKQLVWVQVFVPGQH